MLYKTTTLAMLAGTAAFQAGAPLNMQSSAVRSAQSGIVMMPKQVPHGGTLVDLMAADKAAVAASATKTIDVTERQSCDIELLCNGGLSPLTGFLNEEAYNSVVESCALPDGNIMGLPIVMDTDDESIAVGDKVKLTFDGCDMAVMTVESKWFPDKPLECVKCYGTGTIEHPGVRMVAMERGKFYIGGSIEGLGVPTREFPCASPAEVRAGLPDEADVVAFQCRNPVHRAHYELFTRALDAPNVGDDAIVLVHPTCGPTQEDDIPGAVRHKTYEVGCRWRATTSPRSPLMLTLYPTLHPQPYPSPFALTSTVTLLWQVLIEETKDTASGKRTQWAYLPYSMHMGKSTAMHMHIQPYIYITHPVGGPAVLDAPGYV